MRRFAESTPCPAPHLSFHNSNRYSSHQHTRLSSVYAPSGYGADDDTTANLEYTTEIQAGLRHAKPRRPVRGTRKSTFNPGLDIFEDVAQEEEQRHAVVDVKRKSSIRERVGRLSEAGAQKRSTILAHKAQKIHIPAPEVREERTQKPQRRRVSQILSNRHAPEPNATVQLQEDVLETRELAKQGPKKDPRRRTIYVPSDDTTIMTIHPGQSTHITRNPREKSPDTGLDLVTLSEEEAENLVSVLKKDKKVPRKSLAAPPKRAPLLQSSRQGPSFSCDVIGQGGGKENVPPGMEVFEGKNGTHIEFNFGKEDIKLPATKPARVHFSSKASETSSTRPKADGTKKRVRTQRSFDGSPAKSIKAKADALPSSLRSTSTMPNTKTVKSRITKSGLLSSSPFYTDRSPPTALRRQRAERAPTKITLMHEVGRPQPPKEKYPVLTEDLARPEMYEDNWLTYQEVAITQLLNSIFDSASQNPNDEQSPDELRKKLLELYHEPSMPMLHKRLQASLLYGALSLPKDLLSQTLRVKDDVGVRKKFLNLWVKTYDLTSLRAAAETVIGRQITVASRLSSGSTSSDDGSRLMRAERRAIENFLDTFLIRNEDAVRVKNGVGSIASIARGDHHGDDFGSQGWSWRRTVLRSLMLIHLLDRAKVADVLSGCLFQSTSPHKTSTDVLHALSNMLLPSLGDITRPLGHLNYKVEAVQFPLQEYIYHISNIAIDLRDGVILTRLVELLLYPPTALVARQDDTVTITMPSGDLLTSTFDFSAKESWVLSQHLKFPSIGRPQKLYNVQIALAALHGVKGIPVHVVGGIKAEDIVDGHREKTLSLLWSLVGKYGLRSLVDWLQIVKEIEHFREAWYNKRDNYAQRDLDSDEDEATTELDGLEYHKRLLLSWARCIARTHGLRVANLTTSFANPKVLEAIVDTYLPGSVFPTACASSQLSLAAKLKATGCSTSFIALFATHSTSAKSIPSKDFTLLTLAFLASRLLPLSITHRAASAIQRAFRQHLLRRSIHNHIVKMRVAHECADVARTRDRLAGAATVIQRRWRAVLEKRRVDLEARVLLFQSLARGWAIRRWVRRVTGGRVGGREKVRRVRGGW
ncbi:hypothetical protein K458DRAFT_417126 [Lentithecium fluviatile CBS 122367]|uniref:Calponin-homology (CH) domain-containing protein n=1 Tax=Lentithecium fluviatile CBS 122367 TaxID=1168545 RepID=A0A6G1J5X5_9PLEO|nr:hypothetical protein K458DRAFT_417126 [Lentithecium fluviatile CBS 122367]